MNYYNPCMPSEQCRMPERSWREGAHFETKPERTYVPAPENECMREMNRLPENTVPAMAYVPYQFMGEVYDSHKALKAGTLFPELNKPFKGCCRYD